MLEHFRGPNGRAEQGDAGNDEQGGEEDADNIDEGVVLVGFEKGFGGGGGGR